MNWNNSDSREKSWILGEKFVYDKLIEKYSKDKFLILNSHAFCEMDWIVIDKEKENVIEIYEVIADQLNI